MQGFIQLSILQGTRIDVYETLCPQQMLVHKGGKIKNLDGECRDVTPTKLQCQLRIEITILRLYRVMQNISLVASRTLN